MAHLKNFGVGNFRAIKDLYNFELAPITILTGTNSSGKSSLTKAMLLFKESYLCPNGLPRLDDLKFDPKLQIGNFDTVVNHGSKSNEIIIEVPCRFFFEDFSTIRLIYTPNDKLVKNGVLSKLEIYNNTDKSVFLTYSKDGDEAGIKIDFGVLYRMLLSDKKVEKRYWEIVRELNDKIQGLGFSDIDDINAENIQSYPKEIIELYNEKNNLDSILHVLFNRDTDSFASNQMYYLGMEDFNDKLPLFDYHSLINKVNPMLSDELFEFITSDEISTHDEYKSYCEQQLYELERDAELSGKSISDFLIDREIEELNSLLFKDISSHYGYSDFSFIGCLQSLNVLFSGRPSFEAETSTYDPNFIWWGSGINVHKKVNGIFVPLENVGTLSNSDPLLSIIDLRYENYIIDRRLVHKALLNLKDKERINRYDYVSWNSRSFFQNCIQRRFQSFFILQELIFKTLEYLPSVRSDISRRYRAGDENTEFQKLINLFFNNKQSAGAKSLPFVDEYVKKFELADRVEFIPSSDNFDSRVIIYKGDKKFDLADVGYGYSQLLPIILKIGLQIEANSSIESPLDSSVLIIEEPETNLHPKLQSQLADLFIDCYKNYHIQLIIETHSEYLIRKLQYYTAKRTISPSETQLYYFNHPEEVAKGKQLVKKINILEGGRLSADFGQGFYDETTKLIESIWEARSSN